MTGQSVALRLNTETLRANPYPAFAALQESEPVAWAPDLGMWLVTRYDDVRAILADTAVFATTWPHSPIADTFGEMMLTTEGALHDRYRVAALAGFAPARLRARLEPAITRWTEHLIAGFVADGQADLRAVFASRLPVLTALELFEMPAEAEADLRHWYDCFEGALANFSGEPAIKREASEKVAAFHALLRRHLHRAPEGSLFAGMLAAGLNEDEVCRNASIIFFGGISTVEAIILNCLWVLGSKPEVRAAVEADGEKLPLLLEETLRWESPVQSATRHALIDTNFGGAAIKAGDVVNCMLGGANRDPRIFPDPARFDLDRPNASKHLAFATGVHHCLGFRLAKLQALIALRTLMRALPNWRMVAAESEPPTGEEFRRSRRLKVMW
jgi:cytochrome P450